MPAKLQLIVQEGAKRQYYDSVTTLPKDIFQPTTILCIAALMRTSELEILRDNHPI